MEDYRSQARRRWQETSGAADDASAATSSRNSDATKRHGAPPAAAGSADGLLQDVQRHWNALSPDTQTWALAIAGLALAMLFLGQKLVIVLVIGLLVMYLHVRLPPVNSFQPYFKIWYTEDYFPKISQKIQRELQERASKQQNMLDSLTSQFKGWVMGKTEGIQAQVYYEMIAQYALPAAFGEHYFMRTATVNLGSHGKPCMVTFWGIHDTWMLPPYTSIDFENISVLDEMNKKQ